MAKKSNEYEKLKALWYEKLKKSGFKDIEQDEYNLKIWSTQFTQQKSINTWQAKESYYNMANKFLHDYTFKSRLDQIIWEYHANGMSVRSIATTLKKARIINRTGAWIHEFVIKRLRADMKRMYMK